MDGKPLYRLRNVVKRLGSGGSGFELVVPQLDLARGQVFAIVGVSGSGKSTLLDLLGLASRPTEAGEFVFFSDDEGAVSIDRAWQAKETARLGELRRRYLGYVVQTGGLMPFLNAGENIELCRRLCRMPDDGSVHRLAEALGLLPHLTKRPDKLSVGERQRTAIARALAHRPLLILADEPTAALDPLMADQVIALFLGMVESAGSAALIATHDAHLIERHHLTRLEHRLERDTASGGTRAIFWTETAG